MTANYTPTANTATPDDTPHARQSHDPDPSPDQKQRRSRRRRVLRRVIAVFTFVVVLVVANLPAPYAVEVPGPVVNTIGTVQDAGGTKSVVTVESADPNNSQPNGQLNLLTVYVQGTPEQPPTWARVAVSLLNPASEILPMKDLWPEELNSQQRQQMVQAEMTSSQDQSTAAALRALGMTVPSRSFVGGVSPEAPAAKVLQPGDRLTQIDGRPVDGVATLRSAVQKKRGKPVSVSFVRTVNGVATPMTKKVRVVKTGPGVWLIGIGVRTEYDFPVKVNFAIENIGGPSAGMMFSLAILDKLTPGDLTGGKIVSGTGTVDENGHVGAIGGLKQKMYAAADANTELFLMPAGNCGDAPKNPPGKMKIAVVKTLDEARTAVADFAKGQAPKGLAACPVNARPTR